ncbi:COG4223 family protein, partial [Albidovulum sp.]
APVAPAAPRRRGGFVPLVAGGVIAAGLGAGAALYLAPQFLPRPDDSVIETLRAEVGLQQTRLDQIAGDVTAIRGDDRADRLAAELAGLREELSAAMQPLADRVAALETQGDALARRLDAMETRIVTLEKRPVEGGQASATALEAFGREMEALRAEMAAQRQQSAEVEAQIKAAAARAAEEIARAEERAGQLARQSEAARAEATFEAGLARLRAALDAGTPLDAALADLAKAGVAVPEILRQNATGVPTLAALRDSFADAARAALAASIRVGADAGPWERFTAFLRNQTRARSLTPRAGDDPDAVLSRAEAALRAGDLAMALSELEALPPEGRAKMAEWVARANRRLEVERAVDALAPSSQ